MLAALCGRSSRPCRVAAQAFAGFLFDCQWRVYRAGSWARMGDSHDMLRHGSPAWSLWLFGLIAIAAGLFDWHRLGRITQLLAVPDSSARHWAWVSTGALVLAVSIELVLARSWS